MAWLVFFGCAFVFFLGFATPTGFHTGLVLSGGAGAVAAAAFLLFRAIRSDGTGLARAGRACRSGGGLLLWAGICFTSQIGYSPSRQSVATGMALAGVATGLVGEVLRRIGSRGAKG